MLRCDRVYEKNKQRLRLREAGYSGLSLLFSELHITPTLIRCLLNQVLHTGRSSKTIISSPPLEIQSVKLFAFVCLKSTDHVVNYKDLMALVQLTHRAGPSVRLIVCKRVSKHLHLKLQTLALLISIQLHHLAMNINCGRILSPLVVKD